MEPFQSPSVTAAKPGLARCEIASKSSFASCLSTRSNPVRPRQCSRSKTRSAWSSLSSQSVGNGPVRPSSGTRHRITCAQLTQAPGRKARVQAFDRTVVARDHHQPRDSPARAQRVNIEIQSTPPSGQAAKSSSHQQRRRVDFSEAVRSASCSASPNATAPSNAVPPPAPFTARRLNPSPMAGARPASPSIVMRPPLRHPIGHDGLRAG